MLTFRVEDMTCGHCVRAIKQALRDPDPAAEIDVDLARRLVRVRSSILDERRAGDAIAGAGYAPVPDRAPNSGCAASETCGGCSSVRCACGT